MYNWNWYGSNMRCIRICTCSNNANGNGCRICNQIRICVISECYNTLRVVAMISWCSVMDIMIYKWYVVVCLFGWGYYLAPWWICDCVLQSLYIRYTIFESVAICNWCNWFDFDWKKRQYLYLRCKYRLE